MARPQPVASGGSHSAFVDAAGRLLTCGSADTLERAEHQLGQSADVTEAAPPCAATVRVAVVRSPCAPRASGSSRRHRRRRSCDTSDQCPTRKRGRIHPARQRPRRRLRRERCAGLRHDSGTSGIDVLGRTAAGHTRTLPIRFAGRAHPHPSLAALPLIPLSVASNIYFVRSIVICPPMPAASFVTSAATSVLRLARECADGGPEIGTLSSSVPFGATSPAGCRVSRKRLVCRWSTQPVSGTLSGLVKVTVHTAPSPAASHAERVTGASSASSSFCSESTLHAVHTRPSWRGRSSRAAQRGRMSP